MSISHGTPQNNLQVPKKENVIKWLVKKRKDNSSKCVVTLAFGASRAIRAAAAFPALFSSKKLIVELIISSARIPQKSSTSLFFP